MKGYLDWGNGLERMLEDVATVMHRRNYKALEERALFLLDAHIFGKTDQSALSII